MSMAIWIALFIARRGYDLGSPFASVPVNFHIGFDHKNTRALYEKILAGEFGADHPWDEDELTRLNRWLSAYPHHQKAEAFLNDEKTPWFVAMDSPTLLRERRLQAGRENLEKAVECDPQWNEPKDRLADVDEEAAGWASPASPWPARWLRRWARRPCTGFHRPWCAAPLEDSSCWWVRGCWPAFDDPAGRLRPSRCFPP